MNVLWNEFLKNEGLSIGDKIIIKLDDKDYESVVCVDGITSYPNNSFKQKLTYAILFEKVEYIRVAELPLLNSLQLSILEGLLNGSNYKFIYKTHKGAVFACENNSDNGNNDGAYTRLTFIYNAEVFDWLKVEQGTLSMKEVVDYNNKMINLRAQAHSLFDSLWEGKENENKSRTSEYIWLSRKLDKTSEETHFGKFSEEELKTVISLVKERLK